jgi:hypothetical protein
LCEIPAPVYFEEKEESRSKPLALTVEYSPSKANREKEKTLIELSDEFKYHFHVSLRFRITL